MPPRGLGKGLGALISEIPQVSEETKKQTHEIDINLIDVCKTQPRKNFDDDLLEELAASIKKFGVIQPLIVNKAGDRYTIIAGERRYRASRIAGLTKVPVVIKELGAKDVLQISIIENLQRADLTPIEEARAFETLMREYSFTQEAVGEAVGRSRSAVANALRLLSLPAAVCDMIEGNTISAGHARALLPLGDEARIAAAAELAAEKQMSVRETEAYVKTLLAAKKAPAKKTPVRDPDIIYAERQLTEALETKVHLMGSDAKGKLVIEYFSKEQLAGIYDYLLAGKK